MDSPLSFEATQNFRKKLLKRNLRPFRDDGFDDGSKPSDGELILDDSSVIDSEQVEEIGKLEGNLQIINNIYKPNTENGSLGDPLNIYTNVLGDMGIKDRRYSYPGPLIFSTYSLANIFTNDNPQGSDGSLSQDSDLARISTTQLQAEFQYRIGQELRSETIGRINALDPNNDAFDILSLATGNRSIIEKDFNISVPKSIVGKGLDFISRVTGVYSPYSWIEGSFFNYPEKQSFFNQIASAITGEKENKNIEEKDISGARTKILLENTGKGSKSVLFASLTYNKFVPNLPKTNIIGPQPPQTNFYVGGETSSVKDMIAPNSELPVNAEGKKIQSPVRGYSEVAQEYEKNPDLKIGIASNSYYDEQGSLVGGLTWVSPKYKDDSGKKGEPGGTYGNTDPQYDSIKSIVEGSLSEEKTFTEGSILDRTQRLINSGDNISGKKARLQHVSNAMSQISKVFHDGTRELTKGSRVIRYEDENNVPKGYEYCRVFTKDNPFSFFGDLQKTNGNIRDFRSSVFDKTFDLNITPYKGEEVKKYMFSIENLAWRTSQKKGFTYQDLARCERGQNGGRIMWFPPYDMSVSESITANWTSNDFLGRPEPIYTYNNTSRQGSLSWKIIVDHPSILNAIVDKELKNNPDIDKIVDSFIAGCRTYDIYELATTFPQFTFSDIYDIITKTNVIEDFEEITKEIITVTYPEPEEPVYDDPQPIIVEQDYAFNFYFHNDIPKMKSDSEPKISSTNYLEDLDGYLKLKNFYESKAYGEENAAEYGLPPQKIPVVQFYNTDIETIESKMLELQVKIREALEKGAYVTMDVVGSASSPNDVDYNALLSERRIDSVKKYFLESDGGGGKTLEQYVEEGKLTINSRGSGEEITVTTLGGKTVNCTESLQGNNKIYSINAMACRRVRIENIVETYEQEPVDIEPEDPDPIYSTELQTLRVPKPRTETETNVERKKDVAKIVLKKLLNECDYFERIKEDDPLIYNSIKEKIKFFNPAFHSMTPEGLNSRLTFLQQCMRPGDTIPTINDDGTVKEGSDASNTSFGAPPVCILRIGDFFNTKIVINSININYEPLTFDLNPEGIGVQPMIANIQMSFNFIGGHGLEAPVARLQNALSFNYYANTEMYDERSVTTAIEDVDRLDKKVWELIENKTPFGLDDRPKDETDDEGGDTIGEVTNKTIGINEQGEEILTGDINYKEIVADLVNSVSDYTRTLNDSIKKLNEQYSEAGIKLFVKERKYISGDILGLFEGSQSSTKIFGLPVGIQERSEELFNKTISDIENELSPLTKNINNQDFTKTEKSQYKKSLINYIDNQRAGWTSLMTSTINDLKSSQETLIKNIDKLNFVTTSSDGYKIKSGRVFIYLISDQDNNLTKLNDDVQTVGDDLQNYYNDFYDTIVTENNQFNSNYDFVLPGNTNINTPEQIRLFMVLGKKVIQNSNEVINDLLGPLSEKEKFVVYLTNIINGNSSQTTLNDPLNLSIDNVEVPLVITTGEKGLKYYYDQIFKLSNQTVQKFESKPNVIKMNSYNPFNISEDRIMTFVKDRSQNTTGPNNITLKESYFNQLYSTINGGQNNRFNLKVNLK